MFQPPEALRGLHAHQHLPGILSRAGYRNIDVSSKGVADADLLNLRGAFHRSNGRSSGRSLARLPLHRDAAQRWPTALHWCEQVAGRVAERLRHIFFLERMPNPHAEVTTGAPAKVSDSMRIAEFFEFADGVGDAPFFAHLHLMGSHGGWFQVEEPHWSAGRKQETPWDRDFLDDAIRDFDRNVERIYRWLERSGRLEKTILVVTSDHGIQWDAGAELPLLIRWPKSLEVANERRTMKLAVNTQRLDIAPTVLDALSLPRPAWMRGRSLLSDELRPEEPIFGAATALFPQYLVAGFGRLASITVAVCRDRAVLVLSTNELRRRRAENGEPCTSAAIATDASARQLVHHFLRRHGYELPTAP